MKYLADTHILLWAIEDDEKLPAAARDIFLDEKSEIYYSFANIWEVAIKHSLNKGGVPFSAEQFNILCARSGYLQLMTKNNHAIAVESLCYDKENAPREHRDPFDRRLLAQAKSEKMGFITRDEQIMFWVLDDRCAGAICSTGIFVYDDSLLTIQNGEEIYLEMFHKINIL